jgi:coatomer protein complex subunit epsilon
VLSTAQEWLADTACNRNSTVLLVCGTIYAMEENYVEALKCCHTGTTLEM